MIWYNAFFLLRYEFNKKCGTVIRVLEQGLEDTGLSPLSTMEACLDDLIQPHSA